MKTVCHITTVHTVKDTRIYHKECRSLAEAGFNVKLVVVNAVDTVSDYENVEIINVPVDFKSKYHRIMLAPGYARRAAESLGADIYHFHDPEFLFAARNMVRSGKTVIYDAHEDVSKQILTKAWIPKILRKLFSEVFLRIENRIVKELSAVVTVVEGVVSHMEKMGVKTVLVKNYPDIESLPSPAEWSIKANQICYVGDFTRIRGLFEIITSMSEIEAQLIVAGRWSDRSLKEDLDNLGIPPNVSDLGFVTKNQVQEIFRDSKVGLVLFHPAPNHLDALPNKLFEYLAAGIPVVASNFGWLKKIVEDYDCGIAVDPLNQSEIIKAVNTLLQDQETARKMGENGRQAVLSYFNWETEKMKLVSLYQALL